MTSLNLEDRALAAYLGFAIGDALGATVEFMTKREIAAEYGVHKEITGGGWLKLKAGQVTDDTQMSLALGRSLIRRGGLDPRDVCEEFAAWLKRAPSTLATPAGAASAATSCMARSRARSRRAMRATARPCGFCRWRWRASASPKRLRHGRSHRAHHASSSALGQRLSGARPDGAHAAGRRGRVETREIADALVETHKGFRFDPYPGRSSAYVVDTLQTVLHFYFTAKSSPIASFRPSIRAGTPIPRARWRACWPAPPRAGRDPRELAWKLDRKAASEIRAQVPRCWRSPGRPAAVPRRHRGGVAAGAVPRLRAPLQQWKKLRRLMFCMKPQPFCGESPAANLASCGACGSSSYRPRSANWRCGKITRQAFFSIWP